MSARRGKRTLSKDVYFAQIPEWVLFHEDLKPLDVRLYGVLCRYSEGHAFPGRKLLAEKLKVSSLRTVDAALDRLSEAGAVTVIERWDDAGDRTSNLYEVHVTPPSEVAQEIAPPPATDCTTGDAADCTTGGAADCSVERATFSTSPQPPASGGQTWISIDAIASEIDEQPAGAEARRIWLNDAAATCTKPGPTPHANCRGCRTTPRLLAEDAQRAENARRSHEDTAALRAERAVRDASRPPPEHTAARAAQTRAEIRRTS